MVSALDRLSYAARQTARVAWYAGHYAAGRRLLKPMPKPDFSVGPTPTRAELTADMRSVFTREWRDIEAGLFPAPRPLGAEPGELLRRSLRYFRDLPQVDARRHGQLDDEMPPGQQGDGLPDYYRQNFHFQSDGWLSEHSAAIYDTQVEVLFTGAADVMRRAALAEIGRELRGHDQRNVRYLEAACGSGRFLSQTLDAFPRLNAEAFDLSPAYCDAARGAMRDWPHVQVGAADIVATPYEDAAFDIAANIYLFHELPPPVRRQAAAELARIIKPGGLLVFADSVQLDDAPAFSASIERFPDLFHEPYYKSYLKTDLNALFAEVGFTPERETVSFLTKVIAFRRV